MSRLSPAPRSGSSTTTAFPSGRPPPTPASPWNASQLARVERRYEMLAMQMLRRGDEDRVHALVVQKVAVVEIGLGRGRRLECGFETLCVDVGAGGTLAVL